jgi:hypothetical protein
MWQFFIRTLDPFFASYYRHASTFAQRYGGRQ